MKLLTKAIEKRLKKAPFNLYDGQDPHNIPVIVKYFDPCGRYTFFVTEADQLDNGDWELYGFCVSPLGKDCDEMGTVLLSTLQGTVNRFGLGIERDMHYPVKAKLIDAYREYHRDWIPKTREGLIVWLSENDPNGAYSDEDSMADTGQVLSKETLWSLYREAVPA